MAAVHAPMRVLIGPAQVLVSDKASATSLPHSSRWSSANATNIEALHPPDRYSTS